jgi:hypothetical protein
MLLSNLRNNPGGALREGRPRRACGTPASHLIPRASKPRRAWQRFVAIRLSRNDAQEMEPLIGPHAIELVNRHYNSLEPYRHDPPNIFAVRNGS